MDPMDSLKWGGIVGAIVACAVFGIGLIVMLIQKLTKGGERNES